MMLLQLNGVIVIFTLSTVLTEENCVNTIESIKSEFNLESTYSLRCNLLHTMCIPFVDEFQFKMVFVLNFIC